MGVKITRLFRNSDRVTDLNISNLNQDNNINSRSRSMSRSRSRSRSRGLRRRHELITSRHHIERERQLHRLVERSRQDRIRSRIASRYQTINVAKMRSKQNEIMRCKNKYAVTNYNFECCVCYTDKIQRKKFLRCNHSLCYKCYDKIILPKKCPLCRLSI